VVNPKGGQIPPISTEGDKAEWKKLQKTEKKANASEIINRRNPIVIPLFTLLVWSPKKSTFCYNISKP